jgi:uncharacterized protein (TIGR03437 family)
VQAQVFARGISLWGLVNSTVKGSYIHHSSLAGIDGTHQLNSNDWMSPPLVGVTMANNVIDGTNFNMGGTLTMGGIDILAQQSAELPMPTSPHQNITVNGNFIADPGYASIWMGNVNGGSISGNYLLDPNNLGPNPYNPYGVFGGYTLEPLVVETSQNVTTSNNTIDQTSSRMFVSDTAYNELAAYAPGSVYRLNAYNLGTLTNPSVTLTDSGGNATPVTIKNTATHALDVRIPASAALGGAYFTLTSGSTKYFGTLFLDSQDNIPAVNGCTYETSLSSATALAGASSLPVLVVTQAGCSYQVLAAGPFVNSGAAVTGTGVLNVGLAANTGGARTTTIEIAGQPITLTQASSSGPTITGVVSGASFRPDVSAATWITIQGTNLSATSRQWASSDFIGNKLPTQLDGVSVTIDGIPAYVYYISPTQLNVLSPDDGVSAEVQVQVTNSTGTSQAFTVNESPFQPAFFLFTSKYPAAVHLSGVDVGPTGLISGANFSPATSGETIELFGTGFGPTNPPSPAGTILAAPVPLANAVAVTIGGVPAQVLFAGLASNGLVQLNVTVPGRLPNGDAPIVATVNGTTTQSNLFLTIQN